MIRQQITFGVLLCLLTLLVACDLSDSPKPDPQFVKIHFKYGFRNLVDTFHGHLTKDLVFDGTVSIPFGLSTAEQQTILAELEQDNFFNLPETLASTPGSLIDPDPSPDMLRVQVNGKDKSVFWYYPLPTNTNAEAIQRLSAFIRNLIEARAEYRQLPPARGGYDRIIYTLTIPGNVFDLLDTLTGTFDVLNESPSERRFDFSNQDQFGFALMGEGPSPAVFYPYIVSPAFSDFTLQTGERKVFSFQSAFRRPNGNLIERREYTLLAHLREEQSPDVNLRITVQ